MKTALGPRYYFLEILMNLEHHLEELESITEGLDPSEIRSLSILSLNEMMANDLTFQN